MNTHGASNDGGQPQCVACIFDEYGNDKPYLRLVVKLDKDTGTPMPKSSPFSGAAASPSIPKIPPFTGPGALQSTPMQRSASGSIILKLPSANSGQGLASTPSSAMSSKNSSSLFQFPDIPPPQKPVNSEGDEDLQILPAAPNTHSRMSDDRIKFSSTD